MEGLIILPVGLIAAVSIQCVLAIRQGNSLGNTFSKMRRQGDVLVGKYKHHVRGGAYILLNIGQDGVVKDAKILAGRTIFSRIRTVPECTGKEIHTLHFRKKSVQYAYEDALRHYHEAQKEKAGGR